VGKNQTKHLDVDQAALAAIVERAKSAPLSAEDCATLQGLFATLAFLQQALKEKGMSVQRLQQMLFGSKSEATAKVVGKTEVKDEKAEKKEDGEEKKKGHGRNGVAAYSGAEKVKVPHPTLTAGQPCAGCLTGKVYSLEEPAKLVRITGCAPLNATVYECDRLRCNLCGEVFTAPSPEGVGEKKYDETAASITGLFKYGGGVPFNRIEKLQGGMGIPLPAATQWELVRDAAGLLKPAWEELANQAAQGDVMYNDDTTMKVLDLTKEQLRAAAADESEERTGIFTTGIVSQKHGGPVIALFFTGRQHAGENLADVLAKRAVDLSAPIQMCDALAANTAGDFQTILANCISHSRRQFVDVAEHFPDECRYVLETLGAVYVNDALARQSNMTPEERLALHQEKSRPLMTALETWAATQLKEHKVEPNSGLGKAIAYMMKHWKKLTLFLSEPGAPLDNNICERVLKKAILHRKNSLFYKTQNGARVGDIFMSLIHTTELCHGNPFEYLVALLRNHEEVADSPADWMPWNYLETLSLPGAAPPTAR